MPAAGRLPAGATLTHNRQGTLLYSRKISATCQCTFPKREFKHADRNQKVEIIFKK